VADQRQLCTFFLNERFFGIEVEKVQEVIRYQTITPVPLAPGVVRGLINLRGQIVTAIDMRPRLSLPDRAKDALPMNVVVRTTDGVVSLLVDEIDDVVEVHAGQFESPPDTIRRRLDTLVTGVYKLPRKLLLILDVERTVACGASTHVS